MDGIRMVYAPDGKIITKAEPQRHALDSEKTEMVKKYGDAYRTWWSAETRLVAVRTDRARAPSENLQCRCLRAADNRSGDLPGRVEVAYAPCFRRAGRLSRAV
jgi:hypothetical protein